MKVNKKKLAVLLVCIITICGFIVWWLFFKPSCDYSFKPHKDSCYLDITDCSDGPSSCVGIVYDIECGETHRVCGDTVTCECSE